jgi:HEAT repeat protein
MRSRSLPVALLLGIALGLSACASGSKKPAYEGDWLKPSPTLRMQIEDQISRLPWTHGLERVEQIQWLAGAGEPAYPYLLEACLDPRPDVAASAVAALGATGDSRLVEPMRHVKWPKSDDLALRYEKARAFLRLGDWTAIDTLVDGLEEDNQWARGLCLMALVEATHVDFGFDPKGEPEARAAAVGRWREWVKSRQREGILADSTASPDR